MSAGKEIAVQTGDVVIFYDRRFPPDLGTGADDIPAVNRVAVVIDEAGALFLGRGVFGRKVEVLSFPLRIADQNIQIRKSPHGAGINELISRYLKENRYRPNYFEAGLRALHAGNVQFFIQRTLFPTRPAYSSDAEYRAAWEQLKASLRPLDLIFTLDMTSRLSRFIAWSTGGPWSHVAVHVGHGEIWESVLSGIRKGPIDIYRDRKNWVAAYRHIEFIEKGKTPEEALRSVESHPFRSGRYNYRGALKYGWKSFVGDQSHALTPNSMIYQGLYVLVAQA